MMARALPFAAILIFSGAGAAWAASETIQMAPAVALARTHYDVGSESGPGQNNVAPQFDRTLASSALIHAPSKVFGSANGFADHTGSEAYPDR